MRATSHGKSSREIQGAEAGHRSLGHACIQRACERELPAVGNPEVEVHAPSIAEEDNYGTDADGGR